MTTAPTPSTANVFLAFSRVHSDFLADLPVCCLGTDAVRPWLGIAWPLRRRLNVSLTGAFVPMSATSNVTVAFPPFGGLQLPFQGRARRVVQHPGLGPLLRDEDDGGQPALGPAQRRPPAPFDLGTPSIFGGFFSFFPLFRGWGRLGAPHLVPLLPCYVSKAHTGRQQRGCLCDDARPSTINRTRALPSLRCTVREFSHSVRLSPGQTSGCLFGRGC